MVAVSVFLSMFDQQNTLIARQGLAPIGAILLLAIIVHYSYGWLPASALWLLTIALLFLFRDPRRDVPPSPLAIVSPIDGKIVSVDKIHDPYLLREAWRIRIDGSWWGVFTVRSVMEGKVQNQWFGTLPNDSDSSAYDKTGIPPFAQWTRSDEDDDVITTLAPRFGIKGSRCYVHSGERIGQGKRCSYVPFGSHAETFIPPNSRIDVNAGDEVKAGTSVLATLMH